MSVSNSNQAFNALRAGSDEKVAEIQKSGEAGWEELKTGADKSFKSAKAFFN